MSLSASAENLNRDTQNYEGSNSMCLELALEGERLCKAGDCRAGVAFFQAAIQAGTDDLRTLSAIYSQLGNAYFYLGDYPKAMQYHKHDLTLARTMGDKLGEAKSSGNLGNTLKVMGRFDEAVLCCKRHLELSRELGDKLSEGRALYNLGNVYHAKGKHVGRVGHQDPGEFPEDAKSCLEQAITYYEENLQLMRDLGDVAAQGRACGNLGNTHYLLGDFAEAIRYHEERLSIARQFGDRAAERRAHSNLGNSHIFLGQFEEAAHHYKRTLVLAQELGDRAVEAQACYSLGNTYTLLRDYNTAIEYHLRHLIIAQHLADRVGESRACWSLGNAHAALLNHDKALYFASKHLEISRELEDPVGEATAKMNVVDLRKVIGLPNDDVDKSPKDMVPNNEEEISDNQIANQSIENKNQSISTPTPIPNTNNTNTSSETIINQRLFRVRRESMEQLNLIKLTPDAKQQKPQSKISINQAVPMKTPSPVGVAKTEDEDSFFDLLSKFQSKRMDDQRCSLQVENKENTNPVVHPVAVKLPNNNNEEPEDLLDMIAGMQSKRMDEQRVALPHLPGLQARGAINNSTMNNVDEPSAPLDDKFLEMLARCQGSRLEDQRSTLPTRESLDVETERLPTPPSNTTRGATVPDEDFFSLIVRLQSGRMEDQRATVPHNNANANGVVTNHTPNNIDNIRKKK